MFIASYARNKHPNAENWMLKISDDLLLSGFRQKTGIQPWIGEHIGKFLPGSIPTSFL